MEDLAATLGSWKTSRNHKDGVLQQEIYMCLKVATTNCQLSFRGQLSLLDVYNKLTELLLAVVIVN